MLPLARLHIWDTLDMPPPAKKPAKRPRSLLRKVVTLENGLFVLLLMSSYFLLRRAIHRRIYGSAATSSEGLSSEDAEVLSSDMDTAAYDDGDGDDGPSPSRKNRVQAFGDDGKPKHAYTYTLSHRKNVAHSINNKTLPTVKGLPIYLSAKRLPKAYALAHMLLTWNALHVREFANATGVHERDPRNPPDRNLRRSGLFALRRIPYFELLGTTWTISLVELSPGGVCGAG